MKYRLKKLYYNETSDTAKTITVNFPEDSLFITGGENDIGKCGKTIGALHFLCLTKATKEELSSLFDGGCCDVLTVQTKIDGENSVLRVNGYAFVSFHNIVLVDEIPFADHDKINEEILCLKNKPQYFVHLDEFYNILDVKRLERIDSEYMCRCSIVDNVSWLNKKENYLICPGQENEIGNVISTHHKFFVYQINDLNYGKRLFDELLYRNLSLVYPEYGKKIYGYDILWLNKTMSEWMNMVNTQKDFKFPYEKLINEFLPISRFEKELPLIV